MSERKYDGRHTAGSIDVVDTSKLLELGSCPSCGASVSVGQAVNPSTGLLATILTHPMPFCHYYGATSPEQISADIMTKAQVQ